MPFAYLLAFLKSMQGADETLAHVLQRADVNFDSLAHDSPRRRRRSARKLAGLRFIDPELFHQILDGHEPSSIGVG